MLLVRQKFMSNTGTSVHPLKMIEFNAIVIGLGFGRWGPARREEEVDNSL